MRYAVALVVILASAGITAFFRWGSWAALLSVSLAFLTTLSLRIAFRLCWNFAPPQARRGYFGFWKRLGEVTWDEIEDFGEAWTHAPWPIRLLMSIAAALVSGFAAFVLLIFPRHIRHMWFGPMLQEKVVPYLLRTATARSVEHAVPESMRRMPKAVRLLVSRPYIKVWFFTAELGVSTRQVGRTAIREAKERYGY